VSGAVPHEKEVTMSIRRSLSYVLLLAAFPLVGCASDADAPVVGEEARDPAATPVTPEEIASAAAEPACELSHFDFAATGDPELDARAQEEAVELMRADGDPSRTAPDGPDPLSCGSDYYFHPSNGSHGGWINTWRLCNDGWDAGRQMWRMHICSGGTAPVRYWNPQSCGGGIHNWYPQGWYGYVRTGGGCC